MKKIFIAFYVFLFFILFILAIAASNLDLDEMIKQHSQYSTTPVVEDILSLYP